ncbi:MAG TPA: hypothetical protein VF194_14720 [Ferrovibrio sp.]|uniref:hypothetical protein n=1 Tax=Ferrovibrio sp. TaxID=1917215 RepID=UPI002ED67B03
MRRVDRALLAVLLIATPDVAAAQSLRGALEWLPPGSLSVAALSSRPGEALDGGERQSFYVEFGRLAFRSPDILGGRARKAGLSCQACHSNGFSTAEFFIPGLSDAPGRIDVSNSFWNLRGENRRDDPLTIPSLRGVKAKPRLGHDGRTASLREFTRRVIVTEFGGDEPAPVLLDALVAYEEALRPADPAREPITLEGDLGDLRRYLDALAVPLAEENMPVAGMIAQMIRGQLGIIDERFPEDEAVHRVLAGWSRRLAQIATLAEAGEWPQARAARDGLAADVLQPPAAFAAAPLSLYDPVRLAAWISRQVR